MISGQNTDLGPGDIVSAVSDLAGVQALDGSIVPVESLGPGVVLKTEPGGRVWVHWVEADLDACVEAGDVCSSGQDAHLITVYRRGEDGPAKLHKHMVVTGAGLEHNWTVELWPSYIVRVIRDPDAAAWTFTYSWVFEQIVVWWPQPPDDDDAEALTVAEAATDDKR